MTNHPAKPATYRPFTDPAELRDELADLDALTAAVFDPDVLLRDRIATLIADWQDTDLLLVSVPNDAPPDDELDAANDRQAARRSLA